MKRRENGITLIALVVTIIVLIILAGVSINLVLGENGIIEKAKDSKEISEEKSAKEKLEMELGSLSINKETNVGYNDEICDNYLLDKGFIVNDNIVISNGWQFQIDKSVPKIVQSLGKGTEIEQIEITGTVEYLSDYTKANLKVLIEYEKDIVQIKVNGEEIEVPTKTDGKYEISKEILQNGKYNIYVKDKNNGYKLVSVTSTEISEDMTIATAEELVAFRDRVNKGATYEGRTITLISDIDLSSVCGEGIGNWEPIGSTSANAFRGIFNGDNNTIEKLYINSTNNFKGLFGFTDNAIVKNLIISNSTIQASNYVGTVVANSASIIIENVHVTSSVTVIATTPNQYGCYVGGLVGQAPGTCRISKSSNNATVTGSGNYVGGIAGVFSGTIYECYNDGIVKGNEANDVGGIIGINVGKNVNTIISNCYNKGDISGNDIVGGIIGTIHGSEGTVNITNCYNIGNVSGSGNRVSEMIASSEERITITNCYTKTDEITAANLGEAYVEDEKVINEGYPILKWQAK